MKRLRTPVSFASIAVILAVVGYFGFRARRPPGTVAPVRILCTEAWLDETRVREFARTRNARVELYTYRRTSEFLRQIANADGRIDVLCTSSLLLRSLVRGGWIKRVDFQNLPHARDLAADFVHLPHDPDFVYGVPLFWSSYGYLSARPLAGKLSEIIGRGRVGAWGTALNFMALLTNQGVRFADRLESEDARGLQNEVQRFANAVTAIDPAGPDAGADARAWLKRFDVAHVPQTAVPAGAGFFQPGEEGGIVDVAVLAIGERAANPELARALIDDAIEPAAALTQAVRTGLGTPLAAGEGDARLKPAQRPSALRQTPLTKLRFPDVDAEATLKFSRVFEKSR